MTESNGDFAVEFHDAEPEYLSDYALPDDPSWNRPEMAIRHAVAIKGRRTKEVIDELVSRLDTYAADYGLARYGSLSMERWDFGHHTGIASHFRITDVAKFVLAVERDAKKGVLSRLSKLSLWRRVWLAVSNKWEESV